MRIQFLKLTYFAYDWYEKTIKLRFLKFKYIISVIVCNAICVSTAHICDSSSWCSVYVLSLHPHLFL